MNTWLDRYVVFFGRGESRNGGWDDFLGSFDTVQDAIDGLKSRYLRNPSTNCWFQIVDLEDDNFRKDGVFSRNGEPDFTEI